MKTPLFLTTLLICLTACTQLAYSQQKKGRLTYREQLFVDCSRALPGLYAHKDFDSISYYIQFRWQQGKGQPDPDLLCLTILLSIERHVFSFADISGSDGMTDPLIGQLRTYAGYFAEYHARHETLSYYSRSGFDATIPDRDFFFTASLWASDLLRTRTLTADETFFCRVFNGQIRYPDYAIWQNIGNPDSTYNTYNPPRQLKVGAVFYTGSGIWIPNGHLAILGVHPSVDYGLGVRSKRNEWDLNASLRFVSTPTSYTIIRNDIPYTRNFYQGGYVDFEYCHYFLEHRRWEAGPLVGIGADFFDVAHQNDSTFTPTELAVFNFNAGLRYNYFFAQHFYVAATARYHFIHYNNPGGTPLDGNAFTFTITIGVTNGRNR